MPFKQTEWTPQAGKIPCLSIQQPFTQAIILGKKSIELRLWKTSYRGLIAIHAGKKWYGDVDFVKGAYEHEVRPLAEIVTRLQLPPKVRDYPTGAIIGIARLVRCSRFTEEGWKRLRDQHANTGLWNPEAFGWQFEDVQALPEPIFDVRGYPGLFGVDYEPIERALAVAVK
jgi:hypothetical protein